MTEFLVNFIRGNKIDSFQKLNLLLFLYQHPDFTGTSQQFAERLYWGDVALMERIIDEMFAVGLLRCANQRCALPEDQSLQSSLHSLHLAYSDPLARQKLLNLIRGSANFS